MATAAKAKISTDNTAGSDSILIFAMDEMRAPFLLRCAAMCIDYLLLVALPSAWLVVGTAIGLSSAGGVGTTVWSIAIIIFVSNFLVFPLATGRSLGKYLTGLSVVNTDGTRVAPGKVLLRNTVGYLITVATVGLGFIMAAINSSGRTLHDLLTGTVVIRGRRSQL